MNEYVERIIEVTTNLLGRETIVRKVKNKEQYYILDVAFSHFQKADRNRTVGYRTGYCYQELDGINYLKFIIVHSPIIAENFKNNFDFNIFIDSLRNTSKFRTFHYLVYDGKLNNKFEKGIRFRYDNFHLFEDLLLDLNKLQDLKSLLFCKKKIDTKEGSKYPIAAGNTLYLGLANNLKIDDILEIIESTWDLFLWLYPTKPIFNRNANLNRSMKSIKKTCEFKYIIDLPVNILNIKCDEKTEAAHIKPHQFGGSDKLENGLWLCKSHHKLTEGKLIGNRTLDIINVKFVDKL